MIELWVPFPPSANHLHSSGRGRRFMTAAYRDWLKDAEEHVDIPDIKQHIAGPYKLFVTAARPDKRRRDLDNIIKPVSDLLTRVGIIEDDHWCEAIHARWVTNGDGVAVRVERAGVE